MIEYPHYDLEIEIEDVERNAYELLDEINEALGDVVKNLYDLELRFRRFSSLRKIEVLP